MRPPAASRHDEFLRGHAQVVQTVISASELQEIPVGEPDHGLTLRSTNANAWPASGLGFTQYQIDVSTAAAPNALVALYANNEGATSCGFAAGRSRC